MRRRRCYWISPRIKFPRRSPAGVHSRLLYLLGFSLCFASLTYAQTGSTITGSSASTGTASATTGATPHTHAASRSVHGTVASADATAKSFTVHPTTGSDVTVKVNDKTTYWVGKKKGTWDDVKVGASVVVNYHNDGADNWALRVVVKASDAGHHPWPTG